MIYKKINKLTNKEVYDLLDKINENNKKNKEPKRFFLVICSKCSFVGISVKLFNEHICLAYDYTFDEELLKKLNLIRKMKRTPTCAERKLAEEDLEFSNKLYHENIKEDDEYWE